MEYDGQSWVLELDRRPWVSVGLWGAAGAWIWLMSIALSMMLAQDVALTPQPNQEMWMRVSGWLPAIPFGGAILMGMIAKARGQTLMAVGAAFVKGLFWLSVAIAFLAFPKAP